MGHEILMSERRCLFKIIIIYENYSFSVSNLVVFQLQLLAGDQKWPQVFQALFFRIRLLMYLWQGRPAEKMWNWLRSFTWQNAETDLIAVDKQSISHLIYCAWPQPIHQTTENRAVFQNILQIAVKLMISRLLPLFQKTQSDEPALDLARFEPHFIQISPISGSKSALLARTALNKINSLPLSRKVVQIPWPEGWNDIPR